MKHNLFFPFNYLYYGIYFITLVFLHGYHVLFIDQGTLFLKSYFLLTILCQCSLEIGALVFIGYWIEKTRSDFLKISYISFVTIVFFLHCVEFFLIRIMDISVPYAVKILCGENFENFIEMLYATHIPMYLWMIIGLICFGSIAGGVIFYLFSEKWSKKRPLSLGLSSYAFTFGLLPLCMALAPKDLSQMLQKEYSQTLPWKKPFFRAKEQIIQLPQLLKPFPAEDEIQKKIDQIGKMEKKPDVFLFIIESLREDFMDSEIAPNLSAFKSKYLHPKIGIANGNGTQLSWFSIFYGKFPFYFSKVTPNEWHSGSLGLQCFKKLGYEINVFSSSRLTYYQMDQRIFGRRKQLLDHFTQYPENEYGQVYKNDQKAMEQLMKTIEQNPDTDGRLFIVFLDSTHFNYSWPEEATKFTPCREQINHFKLAFSKKGLEQVKNRYRNAIHYVDSLFGEFVSYMQKKGTWENALVALTGDHGEEFYENGHLFHASNLNWEQIHVPLYFKLGNRSSIQNTLASHVDIFPTLLDYLLPNSEITEIFDGESIFHPKKWPYSVTGRYNGGRSPYEFLLYDGEKKLLARFENEDEIFHSKILQVLQMEGISVNTGSFMPALQHFVKD